MADKPDDEEPETFVQKAVKIGLIAIPLMMYVSWAHKKFFPCPKLKCQPSRGSLVKKSFMKGKRKNKKDNCLDVKPAKQERKRKTCDCAPPVDHDQHLSWFGETKEKEIEPNEAQYMDYIKRSTEDFCEAQGKQENKAQGKQENEIPRKKDAQHSSDAHQQRKKVDDPCDQHKEKRAENDSRSHSNDQSDEISPEAFDKLFEEHFRKCVDEFKQHKTTLEKELERLQETRRAETKQKQSTEADKKGNYLECLADLNLDKDLGCDPNFYSKDLDTPYVVRDYKCKTTKRSAAENIQLGRNETNKNTYLECLTDLNMDKHFEGKQHSVGNNMSDECCPKVNEKVNTKNKTEECTSESYRKSEDLCENMARSSKKQSADDNTIYKNPKLDDCGCDPHFNTKDTEKCGNVKGEPCAYRSVEEPDTDGDPLKNFWHACGPPKGLRTGCLAEGCNDPSDQRK